MYRVKHFINGKHVTSNTGTLELFNPATGVMIGHVEMANQAIVNEAVAAAVAAFPQWSGMTALKRSRIISHFKELLEKHIDDLAQLITQEHGKTLADAKGSIQRGMDVVEFACGIPNYLKGSYSENVSTNMDMYSIRQPLGVCLGITPFNFPAMISLWMFPLAIACGNTFILKPSEKDPSVIVRIAELAIEAGILPGVVNVVQGDKFAVDLLIAHHDIQAVSSVGSTLVAEHIYKTSAAYGKRVQAFGGAKNHCVVTPDADLETTINAIVGAAFGSAGERCMAISVVVSVGDQLADILIEKLIPRIRALKIGKGDESGVEIGPLVTKAHLDKVKSYVDIGVKEGAKLLVDGRNYQSEKYPNGFYMGGCLFDHVKSNMQIYREEIFGPVLLIMRVPDLDAALQLVNQHEYGNGTAIFTRDGHTARTYTNKVQVGMVGVNVPIPVPAAFHSFGGWKRSMFGDMTMHGTESISFYTKLKTVTQHWVPTKEGSEFIMPTH
ncbi:MAG: CoA-acylating methylmalonate-semialdehyde dehydrogenase [Gammaproteobacteria bacterium]|nr:CoA-acylating methylmalonate-semialdehyde dehydrogenase [Gammaproteobacteria bacterium]